MRSVVWIFAAALLVSPAIASGQDRSEPAPAPAQSATSPATTPPAPQFQQQQTTTTTTTTTTYPSGSSHWTASGFVGSEFGSDISQASVDFGGQLGYLWNGMVGAELLADFAPRSRLGNALFANNPMLNAYMVNAVGAIPIGTEARFQPFVSGGIGAIQLSADVLNIPTVTAGAFTSSTQSKFGGDIGAGVMGFAANNIGFRADVRYYKAFTDTNSITSASSAADAVALAQLSGLSFWRANVGVALKW